MKVLWLVNIIMPDLAKALGMPVTVTGGWLSGQLNSLSEADDMDICVVCPSGFEINKHAEVGPVKYIAVAKDNVSEKGFKEILSREKPDIIHIFGTENSHSLYMARAADYKNCLITIQGPVSEYRHHYFDGMPESYKKPSAIKSASEKILKMLRLYPAFLYNDYKKFCENADKELVLLKDAKYFSGRTDWDRQVVTKNNPGASYFHLNENLRRCFYDSEKWDYDKCQKHSIFVSQANYPIKGFHMLLKAAAQVKKQYPDILIKVGGAKPVESSNFFMKKAIGYFFEYQNYIKKLIKQYDLRDNVIFLGSLTAENMKKQYLNANVFVSPSAIENSPNSVGEAMILGTPVISSNVGGVSSMMENGVDGILYDFYDADALAQAIIKIFEDTKTACTFSENARKKAHITHDRDLNTKTLVDIYNEIYTGK